LQPSKNHFFLVVVADFAGSDHQKHRDLGDSKILSAAWGEQSIAKIGGCVVLIASEKQPIDA
jgi:hypothetical protein